MNESAQFFFTLSQRLSEHSLTELQSFLLFAYRQLYISSRLCGIIQPRDKHKLCLKVETFSSHTDAPLPQFAQARVNLHLFVSTPLQLTLYAIAPSKD